ncbi:MAG TPA: 3-ketoacyl-ACP reductase [Hypericibacter adhaerens]|uniref:3-ketoacyl-ACP reductase n=1 Tax=Hypericibacter adhaerens TaxID=2602016 RepID=A0A5J6N457_9PROT|nr:3-ketoacyl-ACP reductase [Hypericibacter adhaerens]QEX24621.1 3-ketoacyl-ACP reductase [Hypericibacter adhaerens]HWA45832.1 3-ketoacyl-ACP reductase [Hypericibacter adhaerens]
MEQRRLALVTGSRRGIGRAAAFALAEAGFDVVINDLERDDDAEATLRGLADRGVQSRFILSDIGDIDGHAPLLDEIYGAFGRLDCLVNNAGMIAQRRGDILEASPAELDGLWRINLRGTFFLTQAAARRMIAESPDRPGRSIVTITSANSLMVSPEKAAYCISKSAASMAAQLFAVRLAEHGIPVFEIRPGLITTEMSAPVRERYSKMMAEGLTPIRRWGTPEEVGRTVASLATGAIPYSIGQVVNVDGGLLTFRL